MQTNTTQKRSNI